MTKADYAEMKFNSALIEEDDFDMLVMGRTQGKGCYCFVNGVLKTQIDKYAGNYKYMVIDNEAGLEHISERHASARGYHAAYFGLLAPGRAGGRAHCGDGPRARAQARNHEADHQPRARMENSTPACRRRSKQYGLDLVGVLPQDETVYEYDCDGKPSSQVPDSTPVKQALHQIMRDLNL